MSKPIEPKFPKQRFSVKLDGTITAPDGFYLLPGGELLAEGDLDCMWDRTWERVPGYMVGDAILPELAWTYARKLPPGQQDDDLPVPPLPDDWEARIAAELARAKRKFPQWPTDPIHAAAVVAEEAGELVRAVNEACYEPHKGGLDAAITEAVQLGAMVRRFPESAGRYRVAPGPQHDQPN